MDGRRTDKDNGRSSLPYLLNHVILYTVHRAIIAEQDTHFGADLVALALELPEVTIGSLYHYHVVIDFDDDTIINASECVYLVDAVSNCTAYDHQSGHEQDNSDDGDDVLFRGCRYRFLSNHGAPWHQE